MIAVIKGDIIGSRQLRNPEIWLAPLKALLNKWGKTPQQWELVWGDFFQLEITKPEDALHRALAIKALIKKISPKGTKKNISPIDVRMAIGLGTKEYAGKRISESNGEAFINAGEKFEKLRKEKTNLAIQGPWEAFNHEMNLYLKLCGTFMDSWSISSAELMLTVLKYPNATQEGIGELLGIKQNSVSGRWNRAKVEEVLAVDKAFRTKLKMLI